jgi:hypothetical protein
MATKREQRRRYFEALARQRSTAQDARRLVAPMHRYYARWFRLEGVHHAATSSQIQNSRSALKTGLRQKGGQAYSPWLNYAQR